MFNSPSSGYVLTAAEAARIYNEIPAVCATKEGAFRPSNSRLLHELAPGLVIWECDQDGLPRRLAARRDRLLRRSWARRVTCTRPRNGGLSHRVLGADRGRQARSRPWTTRARVGMDQFDLDMGSWFTCYPGRARLLHALGRSLQVRRFAAGPADRRLPPFAAAAGRVPGGRARPDREGLRATRPGRKVIAEGDTDRCTVCVYPTVVGWFGRCAQTDGRPY